MRHGRIRRSLFILVAIAALLLAFGKAVARGYEGYNLSWHTVDGGGATELTGLEDPSGLGYTLSGTAGQPDAGVLAGGGYTLGGGFWGGGVPASTPALEPKLYLPLVLRGS